MKIPFLTLILLFISLSTYPFGISDYDNETPSGNRIYNPGGYTNFVFSDNHKEIEGLKKWYFYKDYTIGEFSKGYFIINEKSNEIHSFKSIDDWNKKIAESELKPKIWTRWYTGDWIFYDDLIIVLIFGFFVSIPVIILIIWIIYKAIKYEKLCVTKPFTLISYVMVAIGLIFTILDLYPKSL